MTLRARINVRLHDSEKLNIQQEAAISGLTVSDFVRKKCTGGRVMNRFDSQLVRELRAIHADLAALCGRAKITHQEMRDVLIQIKKCLEDLSENRWGVVP